MPMDCYFCKKNTDVDWKSTDTLRRHITSLGKIKRRDTSGLCAKHQRQVSNAIKKSRNFGLISHTSKYPE